MPSRGSRRASLKLMLCHAGGSAKLCFAMLRYANAITLLCYVMRCYCCAMLCYAMLCACVLVLCNANATINAMEW